MDDFKEKDGAVGVNGSPEFKDKRHTQPNPDDMNPSVEYRDKRKTQPEGLPLKMMGPRIEGAPASAPDDYVGKRKTFTVPEGGRLEKVNVEVPDFSNTLVGSTLDVYGNKLQVHNELGKGGMSVVYRVKVFGKSGNVYWAALKLAADTDSARRAMKKDMEMSKVLDDLGCTPKHFGSGSIDIPGVGETMFMLSEMLLETPSVFLEGDCKHYFRTDPGTVVNMAYALYQHVIKINSQYWMHADIKPENIMIRPLAGRELIKGKERSDYIGKIIHGNYEPLVIDLGSFVNLRDSENVLTVMTTPAWAPPEYLMKGDIELEWDQEEMGPVSLWDTYSLSATLTTMLTGETPYKKYRDNKEEFVQAILREELPYDIDSIPNIPLDEKIWFNGDYRKATPNDSRRMMKKFQQFVEMGTHPDPRKRATPKQILEYLEREFNATLEDYRIVDVGPKGRQVETRKRKAQKLFYSVDNEPDRRTGEKPVNVFTRHENFNQEYNDLKTWYDLHRLTITRQIAGNPEYQELDKKYKKSSGVVRNLIRKQLERYREPLNELNRTYNRRLSRIKSETGIRGVIDGGI